MAIEDTSVKLCQETIIQLDLKIKAITQVCNFSLWFDVN